MPARLKVGGVLSSGRKEWARALTNLGSKKYGSSEQNRIDDAARLVSLHADVRADSLDGVAAPPPTFADVLASIAKALRNRRPGTDNIPNEFLKDMPFIWKFVLWRLYCKHFKHKNADPRALVQHAAPQSWHSIELIGTNKVAAPIDLAEGFRWLGMQASVQKVYMRALGTAGRRHAGRVWKHRSAASVACDVFETVFFADVWGMDLVVCQADVRAAHDFVSRSLHFESLRHARYPKSYIAALLEEYASIKATMCLPDSAISEPFDYSNGLRQGDPESSPAFDEVMDFILEPLCDKWSRDKLLFQLPDTGHYVPYTRIADNIYLFA